MNKNVKTDHKSQTLTYLLVCMGIVMAFSLTLIYPYTRSLAKMDREITTIQSRIKEQEVLYPFYQDLQKKINIQFPDGLSFPDKVTLAPDETWKASDFFQDIAEKNQLKLQDISPDVDSLLGGSGLVTIQVVVQGDFPNIRNFLAQTGAMPYLDRVERIQMQRLDDRQDLELRLNVVVAQQVKDE